MPTDGAAPRVIRTVTGAAELERDVTALNLVPTTVSTRTCTPGPTGPGPVHKLVFGYPAGPPVLVIVSMGCDHIVDNGARQSTNKYVMRTAALGVIVDLTSD
jgi:hypothetical protein